MIQTTQQTTKENYGILNVTKAEIFQVYIQSHICETVLTE